MEPWHWLNICAKPWHIIFKKKKSLKKKKYIYTHTHTHRYTHTQPRTVTHTYVDTQARVLSRWLLGRLYQNIDTLILTAQNIKHPPTPPNTHL